MSEKKKAVTPKFPPLGNLSEERTERINFRCSPQFKEALKRVRDKQKESKSWYERNASDADVIEKAVIMLALTERLITSDDIPYRYRPQ